MGQCSFLVTVLAFRCPLSVYSQIDSGCGIKIVAVFVSAKNTLSRHQPTNPDPGSVSTTSVQNKQPPAPNASNQNNQSPIPLLISKNLKWDGVRICLGKDVGRGAVVEHPSAKVPEAPFEGTLSLCRRGDGGEEGGERGTEAPEI